MNWFMKSCHRLVCVELWKLPWISSLLEPVEVAKQARSRLRPSGKQPAAASRSKALNSWTHQQTSGRIGDNTTWPHKMRGVSNERSSVGNLVLTLSMVDLVWFVMWIERDVNEMVSTRYHLRYRCYLWFVNEKNRLPGHSLRQIHANPITR